MENKSDVNQKGPGSEQMATCHLTTQRYHLLQVHPETFPHFFLFPSSHFLSSIAVFP